jgi:hypothetical protein
MIAYAASDINFFGAGSCGVFVVTSRGQTLFDEPNSDEEMSAFLI